MTLYEAYSYLYDNRKKNPILRGRFLSAFNYWRNGTGPNEDTQRRHLLQAGFTYLNNKGWVNPLSGFLDLKVITVVVHLEKYIDVIDMSLSCNEYCHIVGKYFRIHLAGPEADLKKIQKVFGIPKKMK